MPLLVAAYARAMTRSRVKEDFWFCLSTSPGRYFSFNAAEDCGISVRTDVAELEPRCELYLDERYLFGLLSRLYHWNNAEIGSHLRARRVPDRYRRDAYAFLHYLQA
jgi:hypothetical protein